MSDIKTLAIIPARGGSKGLPRKNILPLCGKPLLAYSIEAAQAASRVDRIVVSTEDEEIAEVALRYGAEVPFLRPKHLAVDDCSPGQVIDHLVWTLYGKARRDLVTVVLYPTHPFRPKGLIDLLVDRVFEGCRLALTVASFDVRRDSFFRLSRKTRLKGLFASSVPRGSSADIGCNPEVGVFHRPVGLASASGAVANTKAAPYYLYPVMDKISLIDIDYLEDFLLAESVLNNNLFDFDTPCVS